LRWSAILKILIPMAGLIDKEAELARLEKRDTKNQPTTCQESKAN